MKNFNVDIIEEKVFEKAVGEKPVFNIEGFLINKCDWLQKLEKHLGKVIVSVRPSGRPGWKELVVITAPGYVDAKTQRHKILASLEESRDILEALFMEFEEDEYCVFECYDFPVLTNEEFNILSTWVYSEY